MASRVHRPVFGASSQLLAAAVLLLACALGRVGTAQAGYIRAQAQAHTSTSANLEPNAGSGNIDSATPLNTGYLSPTGSIDQSAASHAFNDVGSTGDARYDVSVSVGTMRATVVTEGSAAADFVNYPDLFNVAGGNATAFVEWGDELSVSGPAGSTVQILATVVLTASGGRTPFTTADTYNALDFRYLLPGRNFVDVSLDDLQNDYRYEDAVVLDLIQGRSYNLSASLSIGANAAARINDPNPLWKTFAQASMNAGNTAKLYLEVLTPGGSYSLASGTVLTAVPEPSTGLLVGLGLIGLGRARGRSRTTATERATEPRTNLRA